MKWLMLRGHTYFAVREVPRSLRAKLGCRRLMKTLKTTNLRMAVATRHAALAEFERIFDRARGVAAADSVTAAALSWRDTLNRLEAGDRTAFAVNGPDGPITDPAELRGFASGLIDEETWDIKHEHGAEVASTFAGIARGSVTPLGPLIEAWLCEADIEARSIGDHKRAVAELLAWAKESGKPATIEVFNRRVAGAYVTVLLSKGLDRGKTIAKRLWSLSSLWRFLIRKGHVEVNVWTGHGISGGRAAREKQPERPFTVEEVRALLTGVADPVLADLMRLALFSGARIEELALLRVRDIDVAEKTLHVQADPKSPASRRKVPIHSATWPVVEARIRGKTADAFLLHELGPAPKEGRQRSMAISKAFGRYRASVGVDDVREGQRRSLVNFHSFRRTFVTLAEQAGIPESTIRSVVGHKRQGMTFGVYSGGPTIEQRRACVEAVRLP
jgi:integrase